MRREIDLVDDRDNLKVVLNGEIGVRDSLSLDTLRRIDEKQRALARRQRPGYFVREIDVTRCVDEVQHVTLAIVWLCMKTNCLSLDRDPTLTFKVHAIEDLRLHFAWPERAGQLEEPVCECRLAVVDVRDDEKLRMRW